MRLVRDTMSVPGDFAIVLLVGLICFGVPYGYVVGLVIGTALAYLLPDRLSGITARRALIIPNPSFASNSTRPLHAPSEAGNAAAKFSAA